jgi:hypothetical protein
VASVANIIPLFMPRAASEADDGLDLGILAYDIHKSASFASSPAMKYSDRLYDSDSLPVSCTGKKPLGTIV